MNKVIVMGNLGADPELRNTQSGTAVMNLRVASNERVKKGDNWEDHTEWHKVTVWGKRAEALSKFLSKGSKVLVEGRLRTTSYEDKDGNKRWSTEIHADDLTLLDKKESGSKAASEPARSEYKDPFAS